MLTRVREIPGCMESMNSDGRGIKRNERSLSDPAGSQATAIDHCRALDPVCNFGRLAEEVRAVDAAERIGFTSM